MSADAHLPTGFPDGPKLELDQLLDQLLERAEDVKRVQSRLRSLLHAIEQVTSDLGVDVVLGHVVESARDLVEARYAALGVIGADGTLERFVHAGVLGDGADDLALIGFPETHSPSDSFLGVPIRVRGEIFGNLYLADSMNGAFSTEDEALARSLAVAAGTAITNARLYQESMLQQRWLAASAEISSQLIAASGEDPLRTIARRAAEIAEADLVSVGLIAPGRTDLMVEVAVGARSDEVLARRFALADTLSGQAIAQRVPLLFRAASDEVGSNSTVAVVMGLGPVMVLPLIGTSTVLGAMVVGRNVGRPGFSAADLTMAAAFANHASLALELASARANQQRVAVLEDRDRIARDLHDHVIQQLFAIGLSLESTAMQLGQHPRAMQKLEDRVLDLDRTIRQIRTSIFELRGSHDPSAGGLRQELLELAGELAPALGFRPNLTFSGGVDLSVIGAVADDIVACVREALTNVAKHARATRVDVDISAGAGGVAVSVVDNGDGPGEDRRLSGLDNLRARAERRGGSFGVGAAPGGGTQLLWKVPTL